MKIEGDSLNTGGGGEVLVVVEGRGHLLTISKGIDDRDSSSS